MSGGRFLCPGVASARFHGRRRPPGLCDGREGVPGQRGPFNHIPGQVKSAPKDLKEKLPKTKSIDLIVLNDLIDLNDSVDYSVHHWCTNFSVDLLVSQCVTNFSADYSVQPSCTNFSADLRKCAEIGGKSKNEK